MDKGKRISEIENIGFISTRIAGTDGVSLEIGKWAEVLEEMGYRSFYFAGELDRPGETSLLSLKAHFEHPDISAINEFVFKNLVRPEQITDKIEEIKRELASEIKRFVRSFEIDLIIVENAFAIPINIPLGLALTEFVAETGIPTVAHGHDFLWERKRFSVNCVWDYLNKAFPPRHPFIRHVVINAEARNQIALRKGAAAIIIPNVMNYANVWVVKCRCGTRFALKAFQRESVVREAFLQELHGNEALEFHVFGFVDNAHAPAAQLFQYPVMRNGSFGH